MRCSICLVLNKEGESRCSGCGAEMDESRHLKLSGLFYLLGQIGRWELEQRCPPELIRELRAEYTRKRDLLREELLGIESGAPAPPPEPEPPSDDSVIEVEVVEPPPVREERPAGKTLPESVQPHREPFSWKQLVTDRNIRWILNLGILVFSVALVVFIHTQWKGMSAGVKISILFGASFAAMGFGHLLRRTILKATGMALVVLGAVAVPIDFAAVVEFGLVDPGWKEEVGLAGSLFSLAIYLFLARFYSERLFLILATLAGISSAAFAMRNVGIPWPVVVPWLAPLAQGGSLLKMPSVRWTCRCALAGIFVVGIVLLALERLDPRIHVVPIEAALVSILIAVCLVRRESGRKAWTWVAAGLTALMFVAVAAHLRATFAECWWALALLGAAYGLGWKWKSLPFMVASVSAGALALAACGLDLERLSVALVPPAILHIAFGFARDSKWHAFAGWLLGGLALAAALNASGADRLFQPLAYAAYGVAMVALARVRTREAFHLLGAAGAGVAMFLLAAWWMDYYKWEQQQFLGAAVGVVSALAFGPLANRLQSRFVSDITYGCLGFSVILILSGLGVPGTWLGLSGALFAVAYVLLEKRVAKWLLRPTLFTGVACTIAAGAFALLQWIIWSELLQASLTLLLIGAFYLAVARLTPHRWVAHAGTYIAALGWFIGLKFLGVQVEAKPLLMLLPAGLGLLVAARRKELHLGLSSLVVAMLALTFGFLDPWMYQKACLPWTVSLSAAAALLSGRFAFWKPEIPRVDPRWMSGLMGMFASAGYILFLNYLSTGSPWGGLAIFVMSVLLCAGAEVLRRSGYRAQGWPLGYVSMAVTALAVFVAHDTGADHGVHLWVYAAALAVYTLMGRSFGNSSFAWFGAAAGAVGLVFGLLYWETVSWIGVWTFPLAALALRRNDKPLQAFGWLAAFLCPLHAAVALVQVPWAGLVFVGMAALLLWGRLVPLSMFAAALATLVSWEHGAWSVVVPFAGFMLYLVAGLLRRHPVLLYASLVLALAGDLSLARCFPEHAGLVSFPLALVLFGMAYEVKSHFGRSFAHPLLAGSFGAAILASIFAFGNPDGRIIVFLGDSILFGLAAVLFRRPFLMYPCSASLVALDLSLMHRFGLRSTEMAFWLLSMALAKVIFALSMGNRFRSYLQPLFVAGLVIAAGVLSFGIFQHEAYTKEDINLAIWGGMLISAIFGIAGRIRGVPAFIYIAAANLLGAYVLTLHKYSITTLEFYTVPLGIGVAAWSVWMLREHRARLFAEAVALGVFVLPSMVLSFLPGGNIHTLAALGLAFIGVLAGMGMRRRVFLLGGTGAFVMEVLGKALHFLIEKDLGFAAWGMIFGGLIIVLAAAFELRKARFVQERAQWVRDGAVQYWSTLK